MGMRYIGFSGEPSVVRRNSRLQVTCDIRCGYKTVMAVNAEDLREWKVLGTALIQDAMPYLSDDERELLISGICRKCFSELFPPELFED